MGRPTKNHCDYFSHDANMRNHRKVKALRNKFSNGYAIWNMLLEYLTGIDGNTFENSDIEFELMSGDFGVSVTEIRDVVNYCISLEMLFMKDGFIFSESLNERLAPVYEKRGRLKQLSKKQLRVSGKFADNNTAGSGVSVTEKPQTKVKETKVKEKSISEREILFSEIVKNLSGNGKSEEEIHTLATATVEEDCRQFSRLSEWIENNCPRVARMKEPITLRQFVKIREEIRDKAKITELLKNMQNWQPLLKKNVSAYQTLLNWAKREQ